MKKHKINPEQLAPHIELLTSTNVSTERCRMCSAQVPTQYIEAGVEQLCKHKHHKNKPS